MSADLLPATVLRRKAVVYVRQSTQTQVQTNLESQRRQYDLVEEARRRGFVNIEVIDDDLGRSASGTMPYSRGSPRRDAQHGKPVVRCGHRGLVEPNGDTYGSRKNLEREPCRIAPHSAWHPRVSFRGEKRGVAHDVRGRDEARSHKSPNPQAHQGARSGG